jgi:hypothetical protein
MLSRIAVFFSMVGLAGIAGSTNDRFASQPDASLGLIFDHSKIAVNMLVAFIAGKPQRCSQRAAGYSGREMALRL